MSFFVVPKEQVIRRCNLIISDVEERRKRELEAAIKSAMSAKVGWLRRRRRTREEAIVHLKNDGPFVSTYFSITIMRGSERLEQAQKLLRACEVAVGKNVLLSKEDAVLIRKIVCAA